MDRTARRLVATWATRVSCTTISSSEGRFSLHDMVYSMHACLHAYVHTFLRVCDNVSAHAVCTYTSCVCMCMCMCVLQHVSRGMYSQAGGSLKPHAVIHSNNVNQWSLASVPPTCPDANTADASVQLKYHIPHLDGSPKCRGGFEARPCTCIIHACIHIHIHIHVR